MEDIEIVCVIDDGGDRRCFSIAEDRNLNQPMILNGITSCLNRQL